VIGVSVYYSYRGMVLAGVILPILIYLKYADKKKPLSYLLLSGQFSFTGFALGLLFGTVIVGTTALRAALTNSGSLYLMWPWEDLASIVLGASLTEEILFRGFLLQNFLGLLPFLQANILTSLMFTAVHLPTWLADGLTGWEIYSNAAYIFIFSCLLGYVFCRSRSLWTPIVLHAANNYSALAALGFVYISPYL